MKLDFCSSFSSVFTPNHVIREPASRSEISVIVSYSANVLSLLTQWKLSRPLRYYSVVDSVPLNKFRTSFAVIQLARSSFFFCLQFMDRNTNRLWLYWIRHRKLSSQHVYRLFIWFRDLQGHHKIVRKHAHVSFLLRYLPITPHDEEHHAFSISPHLAPDLQGELRELWLALHSFPIPRSTLIFGRNDI